MNDFSNRKRQVRTLSRVDGRTKLGRLEREFRRELTDHIRTKNGFPPNAVERALIEQCVALRLKLAMLDEKVISGRETQMDSTQYIAWHNAFRRALAGLNYGEAAKLIRQTAEAKLLREYSR